MVYFHMTRNISSITLHVNQSSTMLWVKTLAFLFPACSHAPLSLGTTLRGEDRHPTPGPGLHYTALPLPPKYSSLSHKSETLSLERVTGNLIKTEKFRNIWTLAPKILPLSTAWVFTSPRIRQATLTFFKHIFLLWLNKLKFTIKRKKNGVSTVLKQS